MTLYLHPRLQYIRAAFSDMRACKDFNYSFVIASFIEVIYKDVIYIYNPILHTQFTKLAGLVQNDLFSFIDRQKLFSLTAVVSLPSEMCKKLSPQKLSPRMLR